jgi:murein DD-endopeptidase MepM/ murein hydrolase activator NlpD
MFAEDAHLRYDSKHEVWRGHQGWDLVAEVGTPAFAIADGYIAWTRDIGDLGKQLLLQFDNGLQSTKYQCSNTTLFAFYAHLSEFLVDRLSFVKGGQAIAKTGITGNAIAKYPHLHFEIRTTSADLGRGLRGRLDPSAVLGGQLLSCTSEQIGGVDSVRMLSRVIGNASLVSP